MSSDPYGFDQFMRQRQEAARAYVSGNALPVSRMAARRAKATFFGPKGGYLQGAAEVEATYVKDARSFLPDGETRLEVLASAAGEQVAYWSGLQHATVHLRGKSEPVSMVLRVTEVFCRENGAWKMVHRHADPLTSEAGAG